MALDRALAERVVKDLDPPAEAGRARQQKLEADYAAELARRETERKRAEKQRRKRKPVKPKTATCPTCGQPIRKAA